jgi:hypothetical protein
MKGFLKSLTEGSEPTATKRAVRALLHFYGTHGGSEFYRNLLDQVVRAFDGNDYDSAVMAWDRINFGPHGFSDWFPPACDGDSEDYSWAVFESLEERAYRLMSLLKKGQRI